jgi:predicted dehydrogenase
MSAPLPFGIAVIGLGNAAKPHARALLDLQRAGKVAMSGVYARDGQRRDAFAAATSACWHGRLLTGNLHCDDERLEMAERAH